MNLTKEQQLAELKRHFGRRVMDQGRAVISAWQSLDEVLWNPAWQQEFVQLCVKLQKLARRYESDRIAQPAGRLVELLERTTPLSPPSSPIIQAISDEIRALADSCARRSDDQGDAQVVGGRKPVYVCFEDVSQAT